MKTWFLLSLFGAGLIVLPGAELSKITAPSQPLSGPGSAAAANLWPAGRTYFARRKQIPHRAQQLAVRKWLLDVRRILGPLPRVGG